MAMKTMQKSIPDLLEKIKQGTVDPKLLSDSLLDLCIEYFLEQGESQNAIASFLQRNRNTISLHARRILKKRAEELRVRGVDVYELAQRLEWKSELVMYEARKNKDWRLYIETYHKYIERLQSLGVIYKAPDQLELRSVNEAELTEIKEFVVHALAPFPEARLALISAFKKEAERHNGRGESK